MAANGPIDAPKYMTNNIKVVQNCWWMFLSLNNNSWKFHLMKSWLIGTIGTYGSCMLISRDTTVPICQWTGKTRVLGYFLIWMCFLVLAKFPAKNQMMWILNKFGVYSSSFEEELKIDMPSSCENPVWTVSECSFIDVYMAPNDAK